MAKAIGRIMLGEEEEELEEGIVLETNILRFCNVTFRDKLFHNY